MLDTARKAEGIFTARKRSLGQGNVFTLVCQSFSSQVRGGLHPMGWGLHRGGGVGQTPLSDTTGYGQRVGGVHPTGMQSCYKYFFL